MTPPRLPPAAADLAGFTLVAAPPSFVEDPHPTWAALRERSPVHRLAPDSFLLTRYADVGAVYRAPQASSDKRREFGPKLGVGSPIHTHHTTSLVFSDPPRHTRVRRLLLGALNQRALARMEPGVVRLVDGLLDAMRDRHGAGAPVDLVADFAAAIPVEVIGNLLDVPHAERAPLRGWSLAILSALEPQPTAAVLARASAAVDEFLDHLRDLVARRRERPGDPEADVLTRLIQGEIDGERLAEDELLHNCIFLLNAGHETTTNAIGNAVHALLRHPAQWRRLVDDPRGVAPGAVEEALRYEPPLQLNNRVLTAPLALPDGTTLPNGAFVTLSLAAANRDPAAFADPETFDATRSPNRHVAFGHGAHACAGLNVARLEMRVALTALARRHPRLALAGEPRREPRVRFRGFTALPVRLD